MSTEEWRPFTTSAGVELRYGPFPSNMYWDIQARALEEHPDPEPPMKTIEVFDGTEEIEDTDDEAYKAELAAARLARFNLLGEASLEFCVEDLALVLERALFYLRLSVGGDSNVVADVAHTTFADPGIVTVFIGQRGFVRMNVRRMFRDCLRQYPAILIGNHRTNTVSLEIIPCILQTAHFSVVLITDP